MSGNSTTHNNDPEEEPWEMITFADVYPDIINPFRQVEDGPRQLSNESDDSDASYQDINELIMDLSSWSDLYGSDSDVDGNPDTEPPVDDAFRARPSEDSCIIYVTVCLITVVLIILLFVYILS
ncbi:hypothetical protein JCM33374_g6197 [Metschnikowia sp. JCM 33374]|nr:hypothetical protein JCM33374_g6197 [Metschnikowia sp. JCM 33374]